MASLDVLRNAERMIISDHQPPGEHLRAEEDGHFDIGLPKRMAKHLAKK